MKMIFIKALIQLSLTITLVGLYSFMLEGFPYPLKLIVYFSCAIASFCYISIKGVKVA